MIIRSASMITNLLLKEHIILPENREIHQYGLEMMISTALNTTAVLVLGGVGGNVMLAVMYILTLATLRPYAGGFHASSYFRCGLLYCVMFVVSATGTKVLQYYEINSAILLLVLSINTYFIWRYAPVLHHNRMGEEEMQSARGKAGRRCLGWTICGMLLYRWCKGCSYMIGTAMTVIFLFMMLGKGLEARNREKTMKETMLKNVAEVSKRVAYHSGGLPTWFGFYEPEMPKKVQEMRNKK